MPIVRRAAVSHWQDWVNLVLAVWLFVSPWVLTYLDVPSAAWNAWVIGALVALVSIVALVQFAQWEEWINFVLGLWLLVSPWVMGFAQSNPAALWNHVVVGLVVGGLALWDAMVSREGVAA